MNYLVEVIKLLKAKYCLLLARVKQSFWVSNSKIILGIMFTLMIQIIHTDVFSIVRMRRVKAPVKILILICDKSHC